MGTFSQTRTRSPKINKLEALVGFFRQIKGKHTVPVGDVLVGDAGRHVEHDDTALAIDVVTITQTTELLLTSSVPDIELNLTVVLITILVRGRRIPIRGGVYWGLTVVKPRG
jgi:hypothetical protein